MGHSHLMITLVSVGISCQTAHQIARFADSYPQSVRFAKSPFDWLICPPDSAAKWLDEGLCDFNIGEISCHRNRAYWSRFDVWFWHGFFSDCNGVRTLQLANNTEQELAKLNYQRAVFRALDPATTLFCVSNTQNNLATEVFAEDELSRYSFTSQNIDVLNSALDLYFGRPVELEVITRPERASTRLLERENVHTLEAESSNWKGSSKAWSHLLSALVAR